MGYGDVVPVTPLGKVLALDTTDGPALKQEEAHALERGLA